MTPRTRLATLSATLLAALAMLLALGTAAQAHSVLLSTTPAQAVQVRTSPEEVLLTFNEMPRQRYTTVHVLGPDGVRRDSGSAKVIDDSVHQALGGSRPAGTYTVDWRVISSDGHPVSGQFTYTATAVGSALAAVVSPPADDSGSGGTSVVLIVVIVVVVALVAVGVVFYLRRRRRPAAATAGAARSSVPDDDDS